MVAEECESEMSAKAVRALSKKARSRPDRASEGLLLMNMSMELLTMDEGARWILGEEIPHGEALDARQLLPGEIHDTLSGIERADLPTAKLRLRLRNSSYSGRVFVLRLPQEQEPQLVLALHIQKDSSVAHTMELLATEYNLSDREQQALRAIANGLSSKEAAEQMNVSPNTVKSFLRIIMLKIGVGSRAALLGRLLEYSSNQKDGNSGG